MRISDWSSDVCSSDLVECVGACVNAPVVQINDDYYDDLDAAGIIKVLDALKPGKQPPIGSQTGRQGPAPAGRPYLLPGIRSGGDKHMMPDTDRSGESRVGQKCGSAVNYGWSPCLIKRTTG